MNKEDLKTIEKFLTERLINDIQHSLEQFNKFSNQYFGWEKQNAIKKECLFAFYGFYRCEDD